MEANIENSGIKNLKNRVSAIERLEFVDSIKQVKYANIDIMKKLARGELEEKERKILEISENIGSIDVFTFKYFSAGRLIEGFISFPKKLPDSKMPCIIVNRGGFLDQWQVKPQQFLTTHLAQFSKAGFIVLSSNLITEPEDWRLDEIGGSDLDHIINLKPIIDQIEIIDPSKIIMGGGSRGAFSTLHCLKKVDWVCKSVIWSGLYDLESEARTKPDELPFIIRRENYEKDPNFYLKRSPIYVDFSTVRTPIQVFHGANDYLVPLDHCTKFFSKISDLNPNNELIILPNSSHTLTPDIETFYKNVNRFIKL